MPGNPTNREPPAVLVVDDEAAVAMVLSRGLTYAGYDAVVAGSAKLPMQKRLGGLQAKAHPGEEPRDSGVDTFLYDLTYATGGATFDGSSGSRLEGAFVAALREFRTRYQLSYTPTGVDRTGWHLLEVRVRRPGATIRARPGYTQ